VKENVKKAPTPRPKSVEAGGWRIDFSFFDPHDVSISFGYEPLEEANVRAGAAPFGVKGAGSDVAMEAMERRRNPLKMYFGRGGMYFVTFSCY